jgi:hypothetical protein
MSKERNDKNKERAGLQTSKKCCFPASTQNKAAMAPMTPATLKLLRARPTAPPLLPVLVLPEGVEVVEVLVELLGR